MKQSQNGLAKIIMAIAVVCIILALNLTVHARSLEEIEKSKEIRFCVVPIHPATITVEPDDCTTDCRFGGPAYETAKAFAKTLGDDISPVFTRVEWDEQFHNDKGVTDREAVYTPALLESGTCDCYPSNLTKNAWRMKKIDFVTVFPSRMMIIINKSQANAIKTINDLAGKTLSIEKDTSYHTWAENQNNSIFKTNPINIVLRTTKENFQAVETGQADFTIIDADAGIWSVKNELKQSSIAFPVGSTDEIGWGMRKDDKELKDKFQTFINNQRAKNDSKLNIIWDKHFDMTLTKFLRLIGSMK
jgi:membrane-bound lytic murein transglycosylase F